jgi:hypothetical protein
VLGGRVGEKGRIGLDSSAALAPAKHVLPCILCVYFITKPDA